MMTRTLRLAYVIGRRDFVATVWSKSFLLFLLGPLLIIALSVLFGNVSGSMARQDVRSSVAVVASAAEFAPLAEARERLNPAFGERGLPELVRADPAPDRDRQIRALLTDREGVVAVLTGGLTRPTLTGDLSEGGRISMQIGVVIDEARQAQALDDAGVELPPTQVRLVLVGESAGSLATLRALTARAGQLLLFMLTVLLAGMLLSNLVEEKSNKVIEVLAAAAPVDAIFLGKLFSMLAVSMVGLAVWAAGAVVALSVFTGAGPATLPVPAVGWTAFVTLLLLYYCANYLLLGALFLGIGAQASSIREVQTLSMPVTIGQMLIFLFASLAVGEPDSLKGIAAALFPFSSPLAMVARAATSEALWPHLLALPWQALWVWLTLKLGAFLFRRNAMKSAGGGGTGTRRFFRRRSAEA